MESRLPPRPLFGAFCSVSSCTVLPFNAFGLPFARISRRVKAAYPLDATGAGIGAKCPIPALLPVFSPVRTNFPAQEARRAPKIA